MNYITAIKTIFILLPTLVCSLEAFENKYPVSIASALQSDCANHRIGQFGPIPEIPASDIEDSESSELSEGKKNKRAKRSKYPYSSVTLLWSMTQTYCNKITTNRYICWGLQPRYDFANRLKSVILRL